MSSADECCLVSTGDLRILQSVLADFGYGFHMLEENEHAFHAAAQDSSASSERKQEDTMRAYVLGSILFWAAVFLVWHLYALYTAENRLSHGRSSVAKAEVISASQCSGEVAALLAMSDKLLKAGGPEVPVSLRRNIEHCISFDDASREKIIGTQLIRFFPGEK